MQKIDWNNRILSWLLDTLVVVCILFLCLSLIGFYGGYSFLDTGYQDWIYHAFRVRSIEQYGVLSWDHIWSNGIMYWRSYQYIPHVIALGVRQLFGLSINRAMIFLIIATYTGHFLISFVCMRRLGIDRRAALFGVITALTIASPWRAIKDFSIFFSFALFPLFLYFWIQDIRNQRSSFRLAAFAGISFLFHPIFGYVATIFWATTLRYKITIKTIIFNGLRGSIFLLSGAGFFLPYFTKGYAFTNPILYAEFFLSGMKFDWTLGIGPLALALMAISTFILIVRVRFTPGWAKILCTMCLLLLGFIAFSSEDNLPRAIFQLQLGRATLFVASAFVYIFAISATHFTKIRSRFFSSVAVVIACIFFVQALEISSGIGARPQAEQHSLIAEYLNAQPTVTGNTMVQGVTNVSEVSFFAKDGLRFAHSYNEHLEHHPLSIRFENLFHENLLYTTISKRQTQLVEAYARVLGTEYIFLPSVSPMIGELTSTASGTPSFTTKDTLIGEHNIAALHANWPIATAYAVTDPSVLNFSDLPLPNIHTTSWKPWDDEIIRLNTVIKESKLSPLTLSYSSPETLTVDLTNLPPETKGIFVSESFDHLWKVRGAPERVIQPTSLRLMYVPLTSETQMTLTLEHHWPFWHWPVQYGTLIFSFLIIVIHTLFLSFQKPPTEQDAYAEEMHI